MSNPTITGDSSNVNISNADLVVSQDVHANAYFDSTGSIIGGGGGGSTTSNLHTILQNGNTTSNTITASFFIGDGGLLSNIQGGGGGSTNTTPTEVFVSSGTLTLDMASGTYKTFTANIDQDITTLTVQNHIAGSQGIAYLTSNLAGTLTINGKTSGLSGTGVEVGYDDLVLENTQQAIISFTSDGSNVFTNAIKYPSGVVSGLPTLQQVTNSDNSTTNKVILQGGMVTGNVATTANVIDGVLDLDLGGLSYKTFTCETANNISNISVTGDITGTQGIVFVNATGNITVNGYTTGMSGANVSVSFDDMDVSSGEKALLVFTSDGTDRYFNAVKYPSAATGGISNLHTITNSGNVTTNTVIFNGGFVAGNNATDLSAVSNILTIDMSGQSYTTFTCNTSNNIEGFNISNDITGSQAVVFLTAAGSITLNGYTSNISGSNVNMSYDDILLSAGEKAMIGVLSDGTNRYINAAKFPSASGGSSSSSTSTPKQECFDAYPSTSQNVTSETIIKLDTTRYSSNTSVFSLDTSTGRVTVNKTSVFMINYTISTGISSGSSGSISAANLYLNGSNMTFTSTYMYNHLNGKEENTGSQTCIRQLTSGDIIDIRALRLNGTDTIISKQGGTGLRIVELLN